MRKRRAPDCHPERKHFGHGLCDKCYNKWRRATKPRTLEEKWKERLAARKRRANPDYREAWNKRRRELNAANPSIKRKRKHDYLKWRYNITIEQWDRMFALQGGKCALCPKKLYSWGEAPSITEMTHIDHDHKTGRVRGLLCSSCNWHLVRDLYPMKAFLICRYLMRDFDARSL